MPFHQGGVGTVAVPFTTSPMVLSNNTTRRYSSNTNSTTTSGLGTSKFRLRSPTTLSSSTAYRSFDCGTSSFYSSRPYTTNLSTSTESSRDRGDYAEFLAKYSPNSYEPNIRHLTPKDSISRHGKIGTSSLSDLFTSDDLNGRDYRGQDSPSSSSSASSGSSTSANTSLREPRTHKKRSTLNGVFSNHVPSESAAAPTEVIVDDESNNNNGDERAAADDEDEDVGEDVDEDDNEDVDVVDETDGRNTDDDYTDARACCNNNNRGGVNGDDDDDNPNRKNPPDTSPTTAQLPNAILASSSSSLDPLTNFPCTKTDNTELLTNNNARFRESKIVIKIPGYDEFDPVLMRDMKESPVYDVTKQHTFFDDTSGDFELDTALVQNGIGERSGHGDEHSLPSTSRRPDHNFESRGIGGQPTASTGIQATGAGLRQNPYRGFNEQIDYNLTSRTVHNRLQNHRENRGGLNGLRNIGNTCFMNSVIQCLSNTRPLMEYLLNGQHEADINVTTSSMKGALINAFSKVIHELWDAGEDIAVNTTALKSQIQRFAPRFMGYSQQDAQEFLRYLLEGLHEDVNRVTAKPQPIHTDLSDNFTDSQKAAESWKRYLRSEDSAIVDAFVGQLRSSLRCTTCEHVSTTYDPVWDLSLPIPSRSGNVKLSQCLEHFTREEILDGDEKPTCSKCQMRRKCTKSFSIQKFPKILVIHLKRFSPMERFRGKLNVMVDFPLTGLDLSAFAAPRVQGCTYNLYGVANHSGTTYSGHYTAYCKHPYSGEWHEYNDSRVSPVPARSVVSPEAYVLFYEQQPHSSHL